MQVAIVWREFIELCSKRLSPLAVVDFEAKEWPEAGPTKDSVTCMRIWMEDRMIALDYRPEGQVFDLRLLRAGDRDWEICRSCRRYGYQEMGTMFEISLNWLKSQTRHQAARVGT